MEKNIYCWNECMDKDTGYNVIMEQLEDGGGQLCPACYGWWEQDHEQEPPRTPQEQRMRVITRLIEECDHCGGFGKTTVLRPKYCQHKQRKSGEGCSNEAQFKRGWKGWVCVEHGGND